MKSDKSGFDLADMPNLPIDKWRDELVVKPQGEAWWTQRKDWDATSTGSSGLTQEQARLGCLHDVDSQESFPQAMHIEPLLKR